MVTTARRLRFWGLIAGGLLLVPGFTPAAGARQDAQEKQIIVTVMNLKTGNPVTGVTAPALVLKEDGKDREITIPKMGPESPLMRAGAELEGIRSGKIADRHNWLVTI